MTKPHTRFRLFLVLTLLTLACSAALVTQTSGTRAVAICGGVGRPQTLSRYNSNGTLVAQEALTYPGTTCNGDATYQGAVLDPVSDGSCAYVDYLEPLAYFAVQGSSCTTGAWAFYSYIDVYGPNSVYVSARTSYLSDAWILSSGY